MYSLEARERLGKLLVERRAELDPRYTNRRVFAAERGVGLRVVADIETARRVNFAPDTIRALEVAYGLAKGAIQLALSEGPVDALPTDDVVVRQTRDDVIVIKEPLTESERDALQRFVDEMVTSLVRMRKRMSEGSDD